MSRLDVRVLLALASAQIGFGLFPILGKVALAEIPPLPFAALRVVGGAVCLEGARRVAGARPVARKDFGAVLLYALLGISINQILFIEGLALSTAINAALLMTTIPVFTLGSAVLLGRERATVAKIGGIALALAGALLLLQAGGFDWSSRHFRGNLLLLVNALAYSLYLVLSRPLVHRYPAISAVASIFIVGAVPIAAVAVPVLRGFDPTRVSPTAWACLAGVVVFSTVTAYLLNMWALGHVEASRVALFVYLQPVVTAGFAVALLGERLTPRHIAAGALIGMGIAASKSPPPRRVPA
jgi:drug/metabolite transporter (DMT)-like permease